jgi:hypothetical protein
MQAGGQSFATFSGILRLWWVLSLGFSRQFPHLLLTIADRQFFAITI